MTKRIAKNRTQAFQSQSQRCFDCGARMWLDDPDGFRSAFGLPKKRRIDNLQCTAEHLIARCDGGGNAIANIVGACRLCNQRRHKRKYALDPENYRLLVLSRLKKLRWHARWLFATGLVHVPDRVPRGG